MRSRGSRASIGLYVVATLVRAERWLQILSSHRRRREARRLLRAHDGGLHGQQRASRARRRGVPRRPAVASAATRASARCISSIVAERVLDVIVLLTIFVVTVYAVLPTADVLPTKHPVLVTAIGILFVVGVAVAIWVLRSHHFFARVRDWLRPLADSPRALLSRWGLVLLAGHGAPVDDRGLGLLDGRARARDRHQHGGRALSGRPDELRRRAARGARLDRDIRRGRGVGLHRLGATGSVAVSYVILIRFVLYVPITIVGLVRAGHSLRRLVTATVRYPARSVRARNTGSLALERHGTQMVLIIVGCLAVSALTLLFPSTPTYDPWAWILWGREIAHLDLVTEGGPSWKPCPSSSRCPSRSSGRTWRRTCGCGWRVPAASSAA